MNQAFTTFSPTVRQLRAFLAVYRLRKLSAAAGQLFVTQSAISVLIRQLEQGLQKQGLQKDARISTAHPNILSRQSSCHWVRLLALLPILPISFHKH